VSFNKFIFFAYPVNRRQFRMPTKKTNQQRSGERKGSRSLAVLLLIPLKRDFLALLAKSGRFGKSILSAESFYPLLAVLLSFVKWHS